MTRGNDSGPRRDTQFDPSKRDYHNLPSATNRQWGEGSQGSEAHSYGYEGQGGWGDFTHADSTQGGYGEDQGRFAQSGHGRGGSDYADTGRTSAGAGYRGRGPRNYTRSDDRIVDDLIDRMTEHHELDATQILVMVEGGVVTLTGEVPERRMKHLAEDIADEVSGVRDIENRIRVDNGMSSFGPPGQAVRSGENQIGSAFSSSGRIRDPLAEESVRVGRAGTESESPERHQANVDAGPPGGRGKDETRRSGK